MKPKGMCRGIYLLCILLLVCELSAIEHIGLQVMFPVFAVGTGGEAGIYEEIIKRESGTFLPSYIYAQKSPVKDRRKDSFKLRIIEDGEMITLMELENISQEYDVIYMSDIDEAEDDTADLEDNSGILPEAFDNSTSDKQQDLGQFVKHERKVSIPLSDLKEYEDLVKRFYTIDAITTIGAGELNAEKLAGIDMTMKQTADSPQILIYHTHSQEGFVDSIPGDDMTTIMGVGEHLKEILEQEYGYNVIHHWGKYDVQARDSAYSKSLPAVKQLLEENPTIEVVIDLHRDGIEDESNRLVMELDGRSTAMFMFFNGISRTKSTGKINYLQNDYLQENLAFSFQMKWKAEEYYPGLTRKNYLNAYRYNMHLCPKTLLLELGAQNNTLEEAMNACDPIAHILHMVLSGKEE